MCDSAGECVEKTTRFISRASIPFYIPSNVGDVCHFNYSHTWGSVVVALICISPVIYSTIVDHAYNNFFFGIKLLSIYYYFLI